MATGGFNRGIRLRASTIALLGGGLLLTACDDGFDLGTLGDKLDRRPTASQSAAANVAPRPKPDSRGLITYANYQVIVARRGDTMNDVAARVGMSGAALARHNGLSAEYRPRDGEVLALPKGIVIPGEAVKSAPVETTGGTGDLEKIASTAIGRASPADVAEIQTGPEPIRHVVEQGETAYSIARLYGVSVTSLASWNGLGRDLAVRNGQRLLIPVVEDGTPQRKDQITAAAEPAPGAGSETPLPPSSVEPLPETVAAAEEVESPNLVETRTPVASSGQMVKPVSGKVLRGYSKAAGGNEGLDIAASKGASVKAADAGEVALVSSAAGNSKIVLIRHPDNLYTVYSNVSDVSVKKGQSVSRGQAIAKVAGGSPAYVHFEIRRGTESVDPAPYL